MDRQEYFDQLKYDTGDTAAKPLQCRSMPLQLRLASTQATKATQNNQSRPSHHDY